MDTVALSQAIAAKVASDVSFWVAIVGLMGVVLGAAITVIGNVLLHWLQQRRKTKLDARRIKILNVMLRDVRFSGRWRHIDTLSRVIGADHETTKYLLIELGARGSEKNDQHWGLLEYHPLEQSDQ